MRLKSFVEGADDSGFPLENLPYGIFSHPSFRKKHIGAAIGKYVLDLTLLEEQGFLTFAQKHPLFTHDTLNTFAHQGHIVWTEVRKKIQSLLSLDNTSLQTNNALREKALLPQSEITLYKPFHIPGYTDFYACEQHAVNVGKIFRPNDNPLLPNWKRLPVAYNGRPSTVFVSGKPIHRPKGQILLPNQDGPIYTACRKLDFELEMGIFIGTGNPEGERISVAQAPSHIFGTVMLNDWSARDVQAFEYQPLGPFLSKSFATSISPWVVTLDALKPFMIDISQPEIPVVEYLQQSHRRHPDIQLKIEIQPKNSNVRTLLSEAPYTSLYWTMEQMLAHHTVNNCIMQTGDLLGTGTISGPERQNFGSMLEITKNGTEPFVLPDGEERKFLEDGDTIIFTAYCKNKDYYMSFGELAVEILPAIE